MSERDIACADARANSEATRSRSIQPSSSTKPTPWRDVTLYSDRGEYVDDEAARVRALVEWRRTGGIVGVFFSDPTDEANTDPECDGPAIAEIDWSDFRPIRTRIGVEADGPTCVDTLILIYVDQSFAREVCRVAHLDGDWFLAWASEDPELRGWSESITFAPIDEAARAEVVERIEHAVASLLSPVVEETIADKIARVVAAGEASGEEIGVTAKRVAVLLLPDTSVLLPGESVTLAAVVQIAAARSPILEERRDFRERVRRHLVERIVASRLIQNGGDVR